MDIEKIVFLLFAGLFMGWLLLLVYLELCKYKKRDKKGGKVVCEIDKTEMELSVLKMKIFELEHKDNPLFDKENRCLTRTFKETNSIGISNWFESHSQTIYIPKEKLLILINELKKYETAN